MTILKQILKTTKANNKLILVLRIFVMLCLREQSRRIETCSSALKRTGADVDQQTEQVTLEQKIRGLNFL